MARGQQKIQSQQKAAERQAKAKKQAGHSANAQKAAAAVALKATCSVCKVRISKNLLIVTYEWKYLSFFFTFTGSNAGSKDIQATFWEQTLKITVTGGVEGRLK